MTEEEVPKGKAMVRTDAAPNEPAAAENTAAGPAQQQRFDWDGAAQLNPKYTFDDFVIGAGNQFAHAAARAVGERPSKPTTRYSCMGESAWARPT